MNNEAIERDEALEEVTKQERPYDPDKMCQFNIICREGLKRAVMAAGAAHQMSVGKYAAILLANALGDPSLNVPPKKSTSAKKKEDPCSVAENAVGLQEKLFIACALLDKIEDIDGRHYYAALIHVLGIGEEFKKWKENLK